MNKMNELVELLNQASKAYYQESRRQARSEKASGESGLCGRRCRYGGQYPGRQSDCERERSTSGRLCRDGTEDHDLITLCAYEKEGTDNMKTLKDAKIGETVRVVKLHGEGAVKRRIMDMGITKNAEIFIRKVAPLGDPVEVTVRGYELSLRKADAEMVEVE